jgi:hypothetical protein
MKQPQETTMLKPRSPSSKRSTQPSGKRFTEGHDACSTLSSQLYKFILKERLRLRLIRIMTTMMMTNRSMVPPTIAPAMMAANPSSSGLSGERGVRARVSFGDAGAAGSAPGEPALLAAVHRQRAARQVEFVVILTQVGLAPSSGSVHVSAAKLHAASVHAAESLIRVQNTVDPEHRPC